MLYEIMLSVLLVLCGLLLITVMVYLLSLIEGYVHRFLYVYRFAKCIQRLGESIGTLQKKSYSQWFRLVFIPHYITVKRSGLSFYRGGLVKDQDGNVLG